MSKENGGAAFPGKICVGQLQQGNHETPIYEHPAGMTLRQWYAGKALIGYLSGRRKNIQEYDAQEMAKKCFEIADAMIEEGNKNEKL